MTAMKVGVVTLFPDLVAAFLETRIVKRAVETGALLVHLEPLRRHGLGKHESVDDTPYGGGSGMVFRVDCVVAALEAVDAAMGADPRPYRILLTPQGAPLVQRRVVELSKHPALALVCGRYEGFDERVRSFVDEEISIGDFVLAGGEVAAMAVIEACARLQPGVLGNAESVREESFSDAQGGLLEYPQYTRPAEFRGMGVPEVLTSGDHARVAEWRRGQARDRTLRRRPDLIRRASRSGGDE